MKSALENLLERLGGESRIHYSLDHFAQALNAAGNPEKTVNTIVISGTNGKGTVSLLLSSALSEAGFRVGTYLSPHLQHPKERFLENLKPAPWEDIEAIGLEMEPYADRYRLTYFEFLTLACFCWANARKLDWLVLEVGMGGRLDAVNVTDPKATVLTNIDWDHQQYLGNSLEAILGEKMGIFRAGTPVYTNLRLDPLRSRLEKECARLASPVSYAWKLPRTTQQVGWEGQTIEIDGHAFHLSNPSPGTAENAALAYQTLRGSFPEIPVEVIQRAFGKVATPGRMEVVQNTPRVVLSGDHNPAGVNCLISTLAALQTRPRIVCGFAPDKPYQELLAKLGECSTDLILTQIPRFEGKMPEGYERAAPFIADPQEAVETMLKRCSLDETLLVTGSLYLVGEVRSRWQAATDRFYGPQG